MNYMNLPSKGDTTGALNVDINCSNLPISDLIFVFDLLSLLNRLTQIICIY